MMTKLKFWMAGAAFCAFCATAQAAPIVCSDLSDGSAASNPDGLSVADVQFDGATAGDCYGVLSGNPSAADATAAWGSAFGGGAFSYVAKTSDWGVGGGSFSGLGFLLAADIFTNDGGFLLSWSCNGNCPVSLDVVFGLKAATSSALYLFDDLLFSDELFGFGAGKGEFDIAFKNGGGRYPALSNMSVFVRAGEVSVPEPATLALLGAGLLGLGFMRRRRA